VFIVDSSRCHIILDILNEYIIQFCSVASRFLSVQPPLYISFFGNQMKFVWKLVVQQGTLKYATNSVT